MCNKLVTVRYDEGKMEMTIKKTTRNTKALLARSRMTAEKEGSWMDEGMRVMRGAVNDQGEQVQ